MAKSFTQSSRSNTTNSSYTTGSRESITALYGAPKMSGSSKRKVPIIPSTPEIRQKVKSEQRLSKKKVQNQLADAELTISDLSQENHLLRTVHERQEVALSKYESTSAQLPRLLASHSEELQVWRAKYRREQAIKKELEQKLKEKDAVVLSLSDRNKYYKQLKDKSLDPLYLLNDKLCDVQNQMHDKDNELKMFMNKSKIVIESLKEQLQNKRRESKEFETRLEKSRLELSELRKLAKLGLNKKLAEMEIRRKFVNQELGKDLRLLTEESDYSFNNPAEEPMNCMLSNRSREICTSNFECSRRTVKEVGNLTPKSTSAAELKEIKNDSKKNKLPPEEPQPSIQGEYNDDNGVASDFADAETTDALMVANGTDETIGKKMQLNDNDEESKNTDDVGANKIPVLSKLHSARTNNKISNTIRNSAAIIL